MGQLNNLYVSSSYQGLLKMTDSTSGLTNTLQTIQTGDGSNSPLQMSLTEVNISGSFYINNVPITNGTNGTSGTSGSNGTDGSSGTSGSNGSDGSSGTSGSDGSSGTSGSNGTDGSSGTSGSNGSDGSSGTSGSNGTDGSSGTSGSNGTDGSSGTSGLTDKTGLITTGSIVDTQQITGSLILGNTVISGSLIGNTVNNGLIKIQSEANRSGSIQFENYITSSSPISQSNVVFGSPTGPTVATITGSVVISGSNNIILNGGRASSVGGGTYGYIGGNNNIVVTIPTISTSSIAPISMTNNTFNALTIFDITTGSNFYSYTNNTNQGLVTLRHKSGSFSISQNAIYGNVNSFATQSFIDGNLNYSPNYLANIIVGQNTNLLNQSSSIVFSRNYASASPLSVLNQHTNPTNYAAQGSGSLTLSNNIFIGTTITLLSSGSALGNRTMSNNFVGGNANTLNQISSGSNNTVIANTLVYGAGLIASGSLANQQSGGTVIVGRFNATGSFQESLSETVFVVGTGVSDGSRRNALRIDNNNNSNFTGSVNISGSLVLNGNTVSGDRNGLITTGSVGSTQEITSSISIVGNAGQLRVLSGSILLNNNGQAQITNPQAGTNVMYVDATNKNFFFGNVPKSQSGRFSGDTGNFIVSPTYAAFETGSNNVLLGTGGIGLVSGSNNLRIGGEPNFGSSNYSDTLYIGGTDGVNTNIIQKFGTSGPLQLGYNTQVTGSLNVSNGITIDNQLSISNGRNSILENIAIGSGSLASITTGDNNIAIGERNLRYITNGTSNTAVGTSLTQLVYGFSNTAVGYLANTNLQSGLYNTAVGAGALSSPFTGSNNTAVGSGAGGSANIDGGVYLGRNAGNSSTGSNLLVIDNQPRGSNDAVVTGSLIVGTFDANPSNQTLRINASTTISGSLRVSGDVMFASGSNKTMGTVALDGGNPGTATVSNSLVTANSLIFLTKQTNNDPNAGPVVVSSKGSSTFTITSNHNGDTDTVAYQIINPA